MVICSQIKVSKDKCVLAYWLCTHWQTLDIGLKKELQTAVNLSVSVDEKRPKLWIWSLRLRLTFHIGDLATEIRSKDYKKNFLFQR